MRVSCSALLGSAFFDAPPAESAHARLAFYYFCAMRAFPMRAVQQLAGLKRSNIRLCEERVRQRHDEEKRSINPERKEAPTFALCYGCRNQPKHYGEQQDLHYKLP